MGILRNDWKKSTTPSFMPIIGRPTRRVIGKTSGIIPRCSKSRFNVASLKANGETWIIRRNNSLKYFSRNSIKEFFNHIFNDNNSRCIHDELKDHRPEAGGFDGRRKVRLKLD